MPTAVLSTPAARFRETWLHFSGGEMCEEKVQGIISCNSKWCSILIIKERDKCKVWCFWPGSQEGSNSLLP